jgi:peptidoglycan/xylan/chitin deacetylase (PgdA/CDA1 family)
MSRQIIVGFHGLGAPPDWIDADEKPYWAPIETFAWIVERTADRPDVAYTFDDGNVSDLTAAVPILERFGRTAAFFILTGRLHKPGYLSPGQVRELIARGMSVGLHGRDHLDWRAADEETLQAETVQARADLAEVCGRPIDTVAIPFGAYDKRVMHHLKACGFSAIMTTDTGAADDSAQVRNRTSIRGDMSEDVIQAIVDGRWSAARTARRLVSTFARRHLV